MRKSVCILLSIALLMSVSFALAAPAGPDIPAPCAVLMEKTTGKVIYEKNPHEKLPPASVTKVMTLLLVTEALDRGQIRLDEMVTASEHAAGMGGSQVFLKVGEQMSVHDMLKAVVISSGNDAAVALAEHIAGSEDAFVVRMNERAKELGMNDTTFKNCTGLDAEGHVTSAYDIAVMARELLKHNRIKEYSTIWMDSLRDGKFQLANTNKLIRFYNGATGLKTGSTSTAKFCLAASAMRDDMELVAGILAAETSDQRFASARALLDYGFANYALADILPEEELPPVKVVLGKEEFVSPKLGSLGQMLVDKSRLDSIKKSVTLADDVEAPVEDGQKLGEMTVSLGDEQIAKVPIIAAGAVERLSYGDVLSRYLGRLFMVN